MKTVYICADSFGTSDADYPDICWVDILTKKLQGVAIVNNLSMVCASNLLINLQVTRAIADSADFIIYLGTSCTRYEAKYTNNTNGNLLDRFINKDMLSYSILSLNDTTIFSQDQLQLLKEYHVNFFDLDLAIHENQCIIENTLQRLTDSRIPFLFDRGGFEHPSYGNTKHIEYFSKFMGNFSNINVWDHAEKRTFRPSFHITDPVITERIAQYYYEQIREHVK